MFSLRTSNNIADAKTGGLQLRALMAFFKA
jgi:hypothetical protein